MIATKVENIYETTLPAEVRQILNAFELTITFGLTGSKDALTCMGLTGFLSQLSFWMITPIVLVIAVFIASLASLLCVRFHKISDELQGLSLAERLVRLVRTVRSERGAFSKCLLRSALPVVVRVLFFIYPLVTNVAFEAFSCYDFKHDRFSVLIADVSVTCTMDGVATAEWRHVQVLAILTIVMYPVGLLVITGAVLFHERRAIRARRSTLLSEAVRFLYDEYEPWAYFWEVAAVRVPTHTSTQMRLLMCQCGMCVPPHSW
jgi:hypothetical protein